MDKPKSLSQQVGLTPGKLITVAVLAVVLVSVLIKQFGGSTAHPPEPPVVDDATAFPAPRERLAPRAADRAKATSRVAETIAAAGLPVRLDSINQKAWKSPVLATVVQYDPFALPAAFPQPAVAASTSHEGSIESADADPNRLADTVAKLQSDLEQLKQRGVHVIVRERDQYVALIGDRTIHVGDEIGNGFTVTAIRPDGVYVERKVGQ